MFNLLICTRMGSASLKSNVLEVWQTNHPVGLLGNHLTRSRSSMRSSRPTVRTTTLISSVRLSRPANISPLLFVAAFKPEATQTAMVKKYTQPMSLSKIRNLQKAKHLRDRQQELLILHSQQVQLQAELIASSQLPQTQMEITRIRQQAHHSLRPETSRVHRGMAHP